MSPDKPKHPKNNPGPDPNSNRSQKEDTSRHVYVEPGVQIDLVKDLRKTYETSQSDDAAHNKNQLTWSKVTAGLLFVTAFLAGWQGCLTRKSINNNTQQFRIEIRGYLAVLTARQSQTPIEGTDADHKPWTPGQPGQYCVDLYNQNTGKTPVIGRVSTAYVVITDGDPEEIVRSFKIPPYDMKSGNVMGEGEKFSTECSETTDPATLRSTMLLENTVTIYGVAQYKDIFNEYHETGFCFTRPPRYVLFSVCGTKANTYGSWFDKRSG